MNITLGTLLEDGIIDKGTISALYMKDESGHPVQIWKGMTDDVSSFKDRYDFVDFMKESDNSEFNKAKFNILVEDKVIDFEKLDYSNDQLLINKYKMLLGKFDSNAMEAASVCFINHLKENGIDETRANRIIKTAFRIHYIDEHGEQDWKQHVENDKKYLGIDDESDSDVFCDVEQVYGKTPLNESLVISVSPNDAGMIFDVPLRRLLNISDKEIISDIKEKGNGKTVAEYKISNSDNSLTLGLMLAYIRRNGDKDQKKLASDKTEYFYKIREKAKKTGERVSIPYSSLFSIYKAYYRLKKNLGDLREDIEDPDLMQTELDEMIHWDTVLTKLFHLNEDITLYHISDIKGLKEIKPYSKTVGNKLQLRPYMASWWTPNKNEMLAFSLINHMLMMSSDYERFGKKGLENLAMNVCDDAYSDDSKDRGFEKIYVNGDWVKENKSTYDWLMKQFKLYVYEKTFKMKELGRGNDFHIPEFTTDKEVIPDSETAVNGEDIADFGAVEILKKDEFSKKKSEIDAFISSKDFEKRHLSMGAAGEKKPWLYYSFDKMLKLKAK
jgi:hypothetical protein